MNCEYDGAHHPEICYEQRPDNTIGRRCRVGVVAEPGTIVEPPAEIATGQENWRGRWVLLDGATQPVFVPNDGRLRIDYR